MMTLLNNGTFDEDVDSNHTGVRVTVMMDFGGKCDKDDSIGWNVVDNNSADSKIAYDTNML